MKSLDHFLLVKRRNFRIKIAGVKVLSVSVEKFNDYTTGYEKFGHWVVRYVGERDIPGDRADGGRIFTGSNVAPNLRTVFSKMRRAVVLETNPRVKAVHKRMKPTFTLGMDTENNFNYQVPAGVTTVMISASGGTP